jgi:hypothetical protein
VPLDEDLDSLSPGLIDPTDSGAYAYRRQPPSSNLTGAAAVPAKSEPRRRHRKDGLLSDPATSFRIDFTSEDGFRTHAPKRKNKPKAGPAKVNNNNKNNSSNNNNADDSAKKEADAGEANNGDASGGDAGGGGDDGKKEDDKKGGDKKEEDKKEEVKEEEVKEEEKKEEKEPEPEPEERKSGGT